MQGFKSSDGLYFMIVHCYSEHTGEYLTATKVFRDSPRGEFSLPPNTTAVPPTGDVSANRTHRFDRATESWSVVSDFRHARLYSRATGYAVTNELLLGDELSGEITIDAPPLTRPADHQAFRWDEPRGGWVIIPDFSQTPLWRKDNGELASAILCGEALPHGITTNRPPTGTLKAQQRIWWDDEADCWTIVPDYSQVPTWFKADGTPNGTAIPVGTDLPSDLTMVAPPPNAEAPLRWDDERGAWTATGD